MKSILKSILFTGVLLLICACGTKSTDHETEKSASSVISTSQFKVWGNCDQCKETIENSLQVDGIVKADWNEETKKIQVTYDESKITLDQIQKNIAAAGYDNDKYKGDDTAYANLPDCCQYERK